VLRPFVSESRWPFSQVTSSAGCRLCVIVSLCFALSALAYAQDSEQGAKPTLVRGPFTLDSSLGIDAVEDSNIFQSWTDVQSSLIWKLAPSLLMRFELARSRLEFSYKGDYGWYDTSSADDYDDHALKAAAYLLLGERSGLDLVGSYDATHENRGTGVSEGIDPASSAFPQDPDRYTTGQFLARYTYGVAHTRAFVVLEASTEKLAYQNNLAYTQQFDHDASYGKATFGVRVQPKTSVELSVQARDIRYNSPNASATGLVDSWEYRYLLGVVWETTAKMTGTVRVGWLNDKFVASSLPALSGTSWEVAIHWSPLTYSHLDLSTHRDTEPPIDPQGYVTVTAVYSLGWSYEWNSRLESKLALSEVDSTYRYVTTGVQTTKTPNFSLGLTYKMRRWLRWDAGLDINARNSSIPSYNYNQSIAKLAARIIF
jgi:hypothetical protein